MAVKTGKDGTISVGGSTVGEITGFSFDEGMSPISDHNLNDAAESNVAGRTNWNASVEVMWDKGDSGQSALTIGATVALILYPEGVGSGSQRYTGGGLVTGRSQSVADEAIVTQSFTIQGSGVLVSDTVP